MKTLQILSLAICFFLNLTNSIAQIDPADDFVGYYSAHDTVTILDATDSVVYVGIRDYTFSAAKMDSNHIIFSNFDNCNNTITVLVTPYSFELSGIQGCATEYCDAIGIKDIDTLSFYFVLCLGAPGLYKTSGIAIHSFTQPQSIESTHYQAIRCYPTFTTGEIHFDFPPEIVGNVEIELYDMQGKKVFQQTEILGQNKVKIAVNSLQSAIYYWKIRTEKSIYTGKIAKID